MILVEIFSDLYFIIAAILAFILWGVYIFISIDNDNGKFKPSAEDMFIFLCLSVVAVLWEFVIYISILVGGIYVFFAFIVSTPIKIIYRLWKRRK